MMKRFLSILLVLMLLLPAAALADGGDTFAMISHPSAKYITLREGPSDSAAAIGKFYNGTYVCIVSSFYDATWAKISVNPIGVREYYTGYVKRAFLQMDFSTTPSKFRRPHHEPAEPPGQGRAAALHPHLHGR